MNEVEETAKRDAEVKFNDYGDGEEEKIMESSEVKRPSTGKSDATNPGNRGGKEDHDDLFGGMGTENNNRKAGRMI